MARHERASWIGGGEPADEIRFPEPKTGRTERSRVDRVLASGGLAGGGEGDGFEAPVYHSASIHRQRAYDDHDASLPNAEAAVESELSLPVPPSAGDDDVGRIARTVAGTAEVVA